MRSRPSGSVDCLVCVEGYSSAISGGDAVKGENQCPGIIKAAAGRGAITAVVVAQAPRGDEDQGTKEVGKRLLISMRSYAAARLN